MQKIKKQKTKKLTATQKVDAILLSMASDIPNQTYEYLQAKTGLRHFEIYGFCKRNGIKAKRKDRDNRLHKATSERLKKLSKIDTSQKTQKQLARILGFNKKHAKQACSLFLKTHNIKYKLSKQRTITQERLKIISEIENIKEMDIDNISDALGFESDNARQYTLRFLKAHNIDYK